MFGGEGEGVEKQIELKGGKKLRGERLIEEEPRAGGVEQQKEMEGLQVGAGMDCLKIESSCIIHCFQSI